MDDIPITNQLDADAQDRRRAEDAAQEFVGYVRVALADLDFSCCGPIIPANVDRLERVFHIEGCVRLDPNHFLSGYLDVAAAEVRGLDIRSYVTSDPHAADLGTRQLLRRVPVYCMQGLHRIEAARKQLPLDDQWWIIRLYRACKYSCDVHTGADFLLSPQ